MLLYLKVDLPSKLEYSFAVVYNSSFSQNVLPMNRKLNGSSIHMRWRHCKGGLLFVEVRNKREGCALFSLIQHKKSTLFCDGNTHHSLVLPRYLFSFLYTLFYSEVNCSIQAERDNWNKWLIITALPEINLWLPLF